MHQPKTGRLKTFPKNRTLSATSCFDPLWTTRSRSRRDRPISLYNKAMTDGSVNYNCSFSFRVHFWRRGRRVSTMAFLQDIVIFDIVSINARYVMTTTVEISVSEDGGLHPVGIGKGEKELGILDPLRFRRVWDQYDVVLVLTADEPSFSQRLDAVAGF